MKLTIGEVVQAIEGELMNGSAQDKMTGVSTDSRTIRKGDIFFALKGERDGHAHLPEVFAKGAQGAVIEPGRFSGGKNLICVPDTLRALGDLAANWRRRFKAPVVAITGSNGKTTTKDMVSQVLSKKYRVLQTEGNFNNLIGLPLTLFRLHHKIQLIVLEMGMNAPGEIDRLAEIAGPEVGVITNIGRAHLAGLKDLSGVAAAKGELLGRLPSNGLAILNADDPYVLALAKRKHVRVMTFGQKRGDLRAGKIKSLGLKGSRFSVAGAGLKPAPTVTLRVPGRQNISNALAALAVGSHYGVGVAKMKQALAAFHMPAKRMESIKMGGVQIINDTYNANPDSMKAALILLSECPARRRIAVLGDMLELGDYAAQGHQDLGAEINSLGIDWVMAVGQWSKQVVQGVTRSKTQAAAFLDVAGLLAHWPVSLRKGDLVLIKGSRGMQMERVTEFLRRAH